MIRFQMDLGKYGDWTLLSQDGMLPPVDESIHILGAVFASVQRIQWEIGSQGAIPTVTLKHCKSYKLHDRTEPRLRELGWHKIVDVGSTEPMPKPKPKPKPREVVTEKRQIPTGRPLPE